MSIFGPPNVQKLLEKGDVQGLIKALHYKDNNIRVSASNALGMIGAPGVLPLCRVIMGDEDGLVRQAAIVALLKMNDPEVIPILGAILTRPLFSLILCEIAAANLGKYHDPRGVNALIASLISPEPTVCANAIYSLGAIGDERAKKALRTLLGDRDEDVRQAAAYALDNFGRPVEVLDDLHIYTLPQRTYVNLPALHALENAIGSHAEDFHFAASSALEQLLPHPEVRDESRPEDDRTPKSDLGETIPEHIKAQALTLIAEGRIIDAIKVVRQFTNLGLKEAKEYVEQLQKNRSVLPPPVSKKKEFSPEIQDQVRELARQGQKIEAIKLVRQHTDWGLTQAKDYVEQLEQGISNPPPPVSQGAVLSPDIQEQVRGLARQGKKIDAIKLVRLHTDWGLVEAKEYIDRMDLRSSVEPARTSAPPQAFPDKPTGLSDENRKILEEDPGYFLHVEWIWQLILDQLPKPVITSDEFFALPVGAVEGNFAITILKQLGKLEITEDKQIRIINRDPITEYRPKGLRPAGAKQSYGKMCFVHVRGGNVQTIRQVHEKITSEVFSKFSSFLAKVEGDNYASVSANPDTGEMVFSFLTKPIGEQEFEHFEMIVDNICSKVERSYGS